MDLPRPIAGALLAAALLSVLLLVVLAGGSEAANDAGRGEPAAGTFVTLTLTPTACPAGKIPGGPGGCGTPVPAPCLGFDVQVAGATPPACGTPTGTPETCSPCNFSLSVVAVNGTPEPTPCSSNLGTFQDPAKCVMDNGDTFTLQIVVDAVPSPEGNYNGYQTFLAYGSLLYKPTLNVVDEVFWDLTTFAVRSNEVASEQVVQGIEGRVTHGNGTFSIVPPPPASTQSGDDNPILELDFNCQTTPASQEAHGHTLALLPHTKIQRWNTNGLIFIPNSPLFTGTTGTAFTSGADQAIVPVPPIGWMPLDIDNDGELDRFRFKQPTATVTLNLTPSSGSPSPTPEPTLTPTSGIVLEYPISALLQIDCGAGALTATPVPTEGDCPTPGTTETPPKFPVPGGTPPQPTNAAGCGTATATATPCPPGKVVAPIIVENPSGCGTPTKTPKLLPTDTLTPCPTTENAETPTKVPLPTAVGGGCGTVTPTPTGCPTTENAETPTKVPIPTADGAGCGTVTSTPTETPLATDTPVPPTDTPVTPTEPPTDTSLPTDTPVTPTEPPTDTSPPADTPTETAPPPAGMDSNTGSVPAGGTLTTDKEGDGATPDDPVESAVTVPVAGVVTISEKAVIIPDSSGFVFFGQQVNINAPPADSQNPMVIVFTLDASIIPSGENETTVMLFKNGVLVPECLPGGKAMPDPCVAKRHKLVGPAEGDVQLIVLTSNASAWNFGVPAKPDGILLGDVNGDDEVNSLDALWVLLRAVGAVERVPFPSVGDVNNDGLTDVVDALIILQFDAAIVTELPPGAGGRPLHEGAGWHWPRPF